MLGSLSDTDAPPPYTITTTNTPQTSSQPASLPEQAPQPSAYPYEIPPLLTERACNWLYTYNAYGQIKDRYILDPTLRVPHALLSQAAADTPEAERDTLNLQSEIGAIDVVVRIVDGGGDANSMGGGSEKRRARITLRSNNGSITGKVLSVSGAQPPPKFHLTATSHTGAVYVYIPRSFHGPISVSTSYGFIKFSDELKKNTTTFADGQAKKCFVGDYAGYVDQGDGEREREEGWDGLRLESTYGAVMVYYADEWETKERQKAEKRKMNEGKSFFSRIFG